MRSIGTCQTIRDAGRHLCADCGQDVHVSSGAFIMRLLALFFAAAALPAVVYVGFASLFATLVALFTCPPFAILCLGMLFACTRLAGVLVRLLRMQGALRLHFCTVTGVVSGTRQGRTLRGLEATVLGAAVAVPAWLGTQLWHLETATEPVMGLTFVLLQFLSLMFCWKLIQLLREG